MFIINIISDGICHKLVLLQTIFKHLSTIPVNVEQIMLMRKEAHVNNNCLQVGGVERRATCPDARSFYCPQKLICKNYAFI